MHEFLAEHEPVGAALAVAKNGRLVYARGFGWSDRDRREPLQPAALLRIASISKPITGVAIVQLIQRGRLGLDDRVAERLRLDQTKDPRWRQVTVRQLLNHTGGWDRGQSFDPMFRSLEIARHFQGKPPAMPREILRYMQDQPLDFDPGSRFAYSNFGYSLLGRIVEQASGLDYGEYVRREVLAPLGIRRTRLGATLADRRARRGLLLRPPEPHRWRGDRPNRPQGPAALWRLVPGGHGRAHGGWIASAVDLVRLATAFDRPEHGPLLQPESVSTMLARPAGPAGHDSEGRTKDAYYSCGWNVRPVGSPTALTFGTPAGSTAPRRCWSAGTTACAGPCCSTAAKGPAARSWPSPSIGLCTWRPTASPSGPTTTASTAGSERREAQGDLPGVAARRELPSSGFPAAVRINPRRCVGAETAGRFFPSGKTASRSP